MRCLAREQLVGAEVSRTREPIEVRAWVLWEDGVEELVGAVAGTWTRRAVHVRWSSGPRIKHDAWIWAGACERRDRS